MPKSFTLKNAKPTIVLVGLGGTISSVETAPGSGLIPKLTIEEISKDVPGLSEIASIECLQFVAPGSPLHPDDMVDLYRVISEALVSGADGAVVVQGTDTLEETAFLFDALWDHDEPVVFTGAMRGAHQVSSDSGSNLLSAVTVACANGSRGLGPLVVLNDEIHLARFARKCHTSNLSAFQSPMCGPVGILGEGIPRFLLHRERTPAVINAQGIRKVPEVALLRVGLGDCGLMLGAVLELGHRGLVVDAMGGGHVSPDYATKLEWLVNHIPVVLASRTGGGRVLTKTYGFPGSERHLESVGLVSAGLLDGLKARILLGLLLAGGATRERIADAFQMYS